MTSHQRFAEVLSSWPVRELHNGIRKLRQPGRPPCRVGLAFMEESAGGSTEVQCTSCPIIVTDANELVRANSRPHSGGCSKGRILARPDRPEQSCTVSVPATNAETFGLRAGEEPTAGGGPRFL